MKHKLNGLGVKRRLPMPVETAQAFAAGNDDVLRDLYSAVGRSGVAGPVPYSGLPDSTASNAQFHLRMALRPFCARWLTPIRAAAVARTARARVTRRRRESSRGCTATGCQDLARGS